MADVDRLPDPHRTQLQLHQEIGENDIEPLLAIHLHKAKYHQVKALDEYRSRNEPVDFMSPGVYEKSKGMVAARADTSTSVSPEEAWTAIATEDEWVGAIPVQMFHQPKDVYLRGYPFIIGFVDGTPRVVLNKILVAKSGNMNRVYANEWTRPWVIGDILNATGFNTDNLILATMKADQQEYGDQGLAYLRNIAHQTVGSFVQNPEEKFLEPRKPMEWEPDWQDGPVRTRLLKYETDWSLFNHVGHGDSIRDVIDVFKENAAPKGIPADRGKTLEDVLMTA